MTDTLTLCTLYQYLSRHAEGKLLNKGSIKLLHKKTVNSYRHTSYFYDSSVLFKGTTTDLRMNSKSSF